jgi:hypothetical protein
MIPDELPASMGWDIGVGDYTSIWKGPDMTTPMRRSYIEGSAEAGQVTFQPDPDGPYVLWDDAAACIEALEDENQEYESRLGYALQRLEERDVSIEALEAALQEAHRYLDAAQWWHGDHHRAVKDVLAILDAAIGKDA